MRIGVYFHLLETASYVSSCMMQDGGKGCEHVSTHSESDILSVVNSLAEVTSAGAGTLSLHNINAGDLDLPIRFEEHLITHPSSIVITGMA